MFRSLFAALAAFSLAATASAQTTHTVDLLGISFDPQDLDIEVGDTVEFVWISGFHDVKSGLGTPDGAFDSGNPVNQPGKVFSVTFDEAFLAANPRADNIYDYYCTIHLGFGMVGQIDVRQPLEADVFEISASAGGSQNLRLQPEPAQFGDLYLLTGTTSGTAPGFPVDGIVLPINPDAYTFAVLPPNPILGPNIGPITPGSAATFSLPAGVNPGLVGTTFHHAWVQLDSTTLAAQFASNAVSLTLVP